MGIRVLVIEDDAEIADFIVRGLREEGYTVELATDGEDGGHALAHGPWDLVVLDWWLPGADGLTLLRGFRRAGHSTPVLFLTARDAVSDRVRGLDGGADDYLCKPFDYEELLARVRALSRRQGNATSNVLAYADVRVDQATHRSERAGQRLELTPKEHALLVFFLRHPGEVLTRTRIYEHVCGTSASRRGVTNTLEFHIMQGSARRTLEWPRGPLLDPIPCGGGATCSGKMPARGLLDEDEDDADAAGHPPELLLPDRHRRGPGRLLGRPVRDRQPPPNTSTEARADERLEVGGGHTLAALAAEIGPEGVDWEPERNGALSFGRRTLEGQFSWRGHGDERGTRLDGSATRAPIESHPRSIGPRETVLSDEWGEIGLGQRRAELGGGG